MGRSEYRARYAPTTRSLVVQEEAVVGLVIVHGGVIAACQLSTLTRELWLLWKNSPTRCISSIMYGA